MRLESRTFLSGSPLTVTLASGVLSITGGAGNDSLTGNNSSNALRGGAGNDTLVGLGGVDKSHGGTGIDSITAGDGDDLIIAGGNGDGTFWIDSTLTETIADASANELSGGMLYRVGVFQKLKGVAVSKDVTGGNLTDPTISWKGVTARRTRRAVSGSDSRGGAPPREPDKNPSCLDPRGGQEYPPHRWLALVLEFPDRLRQECQPHRLLSRTEKSRLLNRRRLVHNVINT